MEPSERRPDFSPSRRVFVALALAGLVASLLVPLDLGRDDRGRVLAAATDCAHFPLMYLIARGVYVLLRKRLQWAQAVALAAAAVFALIAGVELVQPLVQRSASWRDAGIGALGTAAGLVACVLRERAGRGARLAFHGLALALFAALLGPPFEALGAIRARDRRFPQLGLFEEDSEVRLWRGEVNPRGFAARAALVREHASQGTGALRVVTPAGKHQGVSFVPGPGRWDGHEALAFDLYNPGEPFLLDVDILDAFSSPRERASHFHRRIAIAAGWNAVSVPVAQIASGPARRRLLLSAIREILFLTGEEGPVRVFFLDNVRLVGTAGAAPEASG